MKRTIAVILFLAWTSLGIFCCTYEDFLDRSWLWLFAPLTLLAIGLFMAQIFGPDRRDNTRPHNWENYHPRP